MYCLTGYPFNYVFLIFTTVKKVLYLCLAACTGQKLGQTIVSAHQSDLQQMNNLFNLIQLFSMSCNCVYVFRHNIVSLANQRYIKKYLASLALSMIIDMSQPTPHPINPLWSMTICVHIVIDKNMLTVAISEVATAHISTSGLIMFSDKYTVYILN